jgi:hypothetical protein
MNLQLVTTDQLAFNYDAVAAPVAIRAREAAERIRLRLRRSAEDIIEIGRDLIAVKDSLPHGQFGAWIEAEFGMGAHTARRFMGVAEEFGDKTRIVRDLTPTALYELAAPKTPLEVREEVERMIEAGEVVTKATIEQLRRERDVLAKGKALAEEEIEQTSSKLSEIEASISSAVSREVDQAAKKIAKGYEDEVARLKREIAELRKPRPAPVIDESGNVVPFGKALTEEDAAKIDAEHDDYSEANFHQTGSDHDKAIAFFGCVRSIAKMNASPKAIYQHIVRDRSPELVDEYMGMVEEAFSQIRAVKELHND